MRPPGSLAAARSSRAVAVEVGGGQGGGTVEVRGQDPPGTKAAAAVAAQEGDLIGVAMQDGGVGQAVTVEVAGLDVEGAVVDDPPPEARVKPPVPSPSTIRARPRAGSLAGVDDHQIGVAVAVEVGRRGVDGKDAGLKLSGHGEALAQERRAERDGSEEKGERSSGAVHRVSSWRTAFYGRFATLHS